MNAATQKGIPVVSVTREISAPVEEVFRAWTEPELILKWMKPDPETATTRAEVDARKGGSYRFEMHSNDGNVYRFRGEFLEFTRNEKLVFSWIPLHGSEPESEVMAEFTGKGATTSVTVTHSLLPEDTLREDYSGGWTHCLDSMVEFYAASV